MSTVKKNEIKNIFWQEGSENVFADLGMPDAKEKFAKAKLAFKINKLLATKSLRQTAAAKLLGVDQSKISLLKQGRLSAFSLGRLIHFLIMLNQDVDIVIKKSKKSVVQCGHGQLEVVCG